MDEFDKMAESIVLKSFDVEKTIKAFRDNGLLKTADEYLIATGECVALIAAALRSVHNRAVEECAEVASKHIGNVSVSFCGDKIMSKDLCAEAIRRLKKEASRE